MRLPFNSEEAQRTARDMRPAAAGLAVISFVIALFPVAVALYLLLLFDVAIPGRSGGTLIGISLLMLALTGVHGFMRVLRRRMLGHVHDIIATHMLPRLDEVASSVVESSAQGRSDGDQVTRDMDSISQFLRTSLAATWLDIGALPVLFLVMLLLHGWLALSLLVFAGLLCFLLWRAINMLEQPMRDIVPLLARRQAVSILGRSHGDVIKGLGMRQHARSVWMLINNAMSRALETAGQKHALATIIARGLLFAGSGAAMAIGGALAINDRASTAVVFAAGALTWLALEPLVLAISNATQFVAARQGWARIDALLHAVPPHPASIELPAPSRKIDCENIVLAYQGARKPAVQGINFSLNAGEVLAIVGPAGSGKSTIMRALAGAMPLMRGKIRLDDAALDQWGEDMLGPHIGYMPQSIQLIDGSVAENIARFDPSANPKDVVAAAQAANAHGMIVRLPDGYNSLVGTNGGRLAFSQAQRIAFARTLYRAPLFMVLDEPTAHVDLQGEQAFMQSVEAARQRGAIIILAGNANNLVQVATHILVLREGVMLDFGPKEEVRERMAERRKRIKAAEEAQEQADTPAVSETESSS
ncbi:MAG: ATP-binding cassette domain-containing protein [Sphingobium sp.]